MAIGGDLAGGGIDDGLADAQAQARSAAGAVADRRFIDPEKAVEDVRQVLGSNSNAIVADPQMGLPRMIVPRQLDGHAAPMGRVQRLAPLAFLAGRGELD